MVRGASNPRTAGTRGDSCRSAHPPFPEDPFALLEHGTIEGIELIPWGSNYTFAALLRGADGTCCYGVYQPRRSEMPLR